MDAYGPDLRHETPAWGGDRSLQARHRLRAAGRRSPGVSRLHLVALPPREAILMARFFIQNFGCRATQADGAALEAQLAARGFECANDRHAADFVILNTCTVTASADEDVRQALRRAHRENPQSRILVTGCYAQRAPEELASLPGVAWVVGNSHKTEIAGLLDEAARVEANNAEPYHGQILVGDIFARQDFLTAPVMDAAH